MIQSSHARPHVYLIDGSGFIFRAFHALPPLSRADGTPVGAVLGFCNILLKLLDDHHPEKLLVLFDAGRQTFRQKIYPDYKANRQEPPPELIPQFALIREACTAFSIPMVEQEGFEADDLIASYTHRAVAQGAEVTIVSSDKDLMQLVTDPDVRLFDPLKNREIRSPEVLEKFGVEPQQVVDVQALMGDSSDNIPGVPGIGVKTAAELIRRFGNLENLYGHLEEIPQPKRRQLLIDNKALAFISQQLVRLQGDIPLSLPLDSLQLPAFDLRQAEAFLKKNEFYNLLSRLQKRQAAKALESSEQHTLIHDQKTLENWLKRAKEQGMLAIDVETTSLDAMRAKLVGIALALGEGQAAYVPLAHQTTDPQLPMTKVLDLLRPLLTDPGLLKIGHNLKYDLLVLAQLGLAVHPLDDTLLLSYVLDGGQHSHSLDFLAQHYFDHRTITFKDVAGVGKQQITFDHVPLDRACAYAGEDAEITWRLHALLKKRLLQEKMTTIYETLERPLIAVLVAMEQAGILVDQAALRGLSSLFATQLDVLEKEIHQLAGHVFNIASPKQLGDVLFEKLQLQGGKKGKTGAYGTSADVLEMLAAQGHLLPQQVLQWRQLAKLKSTYTDALLDQIHPTTHRIHTSYVMAGTSTGRLASTDPNLQNIPIRTEEGRRIRQAFIAPPGYKLVSLDYSQIELRLLAHMGKIESLQEAFRQHQDIHAQTASQVFGVPLAEVDVHLRRRAKTINFGIIYGMSAFGLSQQLGISPKEASAYIEAYFNHYPGIAAYMDQTRACARTQGYVTTLWGRRCYVPGIHDPNHTIRAAAERQAINAPLQGTAADIIKQAMIDVFHTIQEKNLGARLLLQVHDELLLEVQEKEIDGVVPLLRDEMRQAACLDVPLEVGIGIGLNWDEAH